MRFGGGLGSDWCSMMLDCQPAHPHIVFSAWADKAMLAAIVDSSDDAIISKTLDSIITTWNAAAERIFGYSSEEAVGRSIMMLLPDDRADEETVILAKLRNGESVSHFETVRVTKFGRKLDVSVTISPVKDASGQIIGASKIVRDITEQKRAAAAMLMQQSAMEHMARLNTMGEMTAVLAHELNQPLASILNYAGVSLDVVRSGEACPERIAPALQEVINETLRAGEIIRRLRAFISKREPACEAVDVNALLRDSLHLLEHDLRLASITVCLLLSDVAPVVWADPVQLAQVLVNLIRNARDAMQDPTAAGRELAITSSASTAEVRIDVVDQGCGLPSGQLPQLFNHFFTTKPAGLGMGLAISRRIIESFGGRLTGVLNPHASGMTFRITLPVRERREQ